MNFRIYRVSNVAQSKSKPINPKLDQRLAARLQYPGKPTSPVKKRSVKFSSPNKNTKGTQSLSNKGKKDKETKKKQPLPKSRQETLSPVFEPKSKTGRFDKEVQKRTTRVTESGPDRVSAQTTAATFHKKRASVSSASGTDSRESKVVLAKDKQASTENLTRYFDTGMPHGEKNYVPPKGIAQKVQTTGSPNAWENAEKLSSEAMQKLEDKARRQEELIRKASIRGEAAREIAREERKLKALQSEFMEEAEGFSFFGTGSQEGGLGLGDKTKSSITADNNQKKDSKKISLPPEDFFDQFISIGSDDITSVSSEGENGLAGSRKGSNPDFSLPFEDKIEKSLTELKELSNEKKVSKPSVHKDLSKISSKSRETYHETLAIIHEGLREINQVRESNELLPVTHSLLKLHEERTRVSQEEQDPIKPPSVHRSSSSSLSSSSSNEKSKRKVRKGKRSQTSPERVNSGDAQSKALERSPSIPMDFDAVDSDPFFAILPGLRSVTTASELKKSSATDIKNIEGYTSGSTVAETKVQTRLQGSKDIINSTNDQNQIQDTSNASSKVEPVPKPKQKIRKKKVSKQIQNRDDSTMTSFSEKSSTETPESKKGKISPDSTPQGPYTSTPDGKLKLKDAQLSTESSTVSEGRLLGRRLTKKDLILHAKASQLMQRRRESIDALPVSSSSSSNVEIHDSSVDLSNLSRSPSTTVNTSVGSKKSSKSSSSTNRTWETILEEHTLIDDSSYASDADSQLARKISQKVLRKLSELNILSSSKSSTEDSSTIYETKINATVESEDISYSQNESARTSASADSMSSSSSDSKNSTGSVTSVPRKGNKTSDLDGTNGTISSPESASLNSHEEYNISNFEGTLSSPESITATSIPPEDISGLGETISSPVASSVSASDNAQDKEVKRLLDSRGVSDDISRVSPPVRGDTNIQEEMLAVFKSFKEELDGIYIERPPLPSW